MKKNIFPLLLLPIIALAECRLEYEVLYLIAKAERHPKRNVGYPYLISFNDKKDVKKLDKKKYTYKKLDSRSIDCLSLKNCLAIFDHLIANKIENIDLGAFQINYKWHKHEKEKYFLLGDSSRIACDILMELGEKNGWNWKTLASYHSLTPKHNERYKNNLIKLSENM